MTYTSAHPRQRRLFFDIETLANAENLALAPDPKPDSRLKDPLKIAEDIAAKKQALIESAALDPDYGRVLSIGIFGVACQVDVYLNAEVFGAQPLLEDEFGTAIFLSEPDLLAAFWDDFKCCSGYCVGFNILSFDLPYLMARSMYLHVPVPLVPNLAKFRTEPVTDLYAIRYNWGPGKGLKAVCKLLGIPNDCPEVDGSKVAGLDAAQLRAYQISDVKLVMALYERMNGVYFRHD